MRQPFKNTSILEFLPSNSKNNALPKLETYINTFPHLVEFICFPNPRNHYESLRIFIAKFVSSVKKGAGNVLDENSVSILNTIEVFLSNSPIYDDSYCQTLRIDVIEMLLKHRPSIVFSIHLKNPHLLPSVYLENSFYRMFRFVCEFSAISDDSILNERIRSLINGLDTQYFSFAAASIPYVFSSSLMNKNTPHLLSFVQKLMSLKCYEPLMLHNYSKTSIPILEILPYSLRCEGSVLSNNMVIALLRVLSLGFQLVRGFLLEPSQQKILMISQFIMSGDSCIDAMIIALTHFSSSLWSVLSSIGNDLSKIFGSIIASLLSCHEFPSLKVFVIQNRQEIILFLTKIIQITKMKSLTSVFSSLIAGLIGSSIAPISLLTFKDQIPTYFLSYIYTMPYSSSYFVSLVNECLSTIASDPCFAVHVSKKLMFLLPNNAASFALESLSSKISISKMMQFLTKANILDVIPGLQLICLSNHSLSKLDSSMISSIVRAIIISVSSESVFSLTHATYLSKFLDEIGGDSYILFWKMANSISDTRSYIRFLLFITYYPGFCSFVSKSKDIFEKFMLSLNNMLSPIKDEKEITAICIAWRNLSNGIKSNDTFEKPEIRRVFDFGSNALIKWMSSGINPTFLLTTVCEVAKNPVLRISISEKVASSVRIKAPFIAFLSTIDKPLTAKLFPQFVNLVNIVPVLPDPIVYEPISWAPYVSGSIDVCSI